MSDTGVPGGVWFYVPNEGSAIFFAVVFALYGCALVYHVLRGGIRRFFWVVMIGVAMEVGGFICRAVARHSLSEIAPFAVQQSLIVMAPLFIAAGNYTVISRLIRVITGGDSSKQRIFFIPAQRITPIFVTCDAVTILIQVAGTSISAGANWHGQTAAVGWNVLLAGLAIQTVTVAFFVAVALNFGGSQLFTLRNKTQERHFNGLKSIFISSIFIELRCIYRLIEHATGYHGYLWTHEWAFYVFEALPMLIAIGIYTIWYPPHYISEAAPKKIAEKEVHDAGYRRSPSVEEGQGE